MYTVCIPGIDYSFCSIFNWLRKFSKEPNSNSLSIHIHSTQCTTFMYMYCTFTCNKFIITLKIALSDGSEGEGRENIAK